MQKPVREAGFFWQRGDRGEVRRGHRDSEGRRGLQGIMRCVRIPVYLTFHLENTIVT